MKKLLILIFICDFVFFVKTLHAEDPYKQEVLLSTLINKSENIATYSGYYINGYFVNNSPNFSISYLRVNNSAA